MLKKVVVINTSYPRHLDGNATKSMSTSFNGDWKLDTKATSLEAASISKNDYGSDAISGTARLTVEPEYAYNKHQATPSVANFENSHAGLTGQIRLDAGIFDFITRAELNNILLKFDSSLVNVLTETYEPVLNVFDNPNYEYHIPISFKLLDKIGIDTDVYSVYLGNYPIYDVKRNTSDASNIVERVTSSYKTDGVMPGGILFNGTAITTKPAYGTPYIAVKPRLKRSMLGTTLDTRMTRLENTEYSGYYTYEFDLYLAGQKFVTDDFNTTPSKYETFLQLYKQYSLSESDPQAIPDPNHTLEFQVEAAWNACEGIKCKFYDVAGNVTYWVMPHIEIVPVALEDIEKLKPLIVDFINTSPADLMLGTDKIGKTTERATAVEPLFRNLKFTLGLCEGSIGTYFEDTHKEHKDNITSTTAWRRYDTADIDNINESGWVRAFAYATGNFVGADIEFLNAVIERNSYGEGTLGEWIKECEDNSRLINLQIFVPEYIKDTSYDDFVKFTERWMNTMYKPTDRNCYISVLEKVARIGDFNYPAKVESTYFDMFDNDHGDILHINETEIDDILATRIQEYTDEN